MGFGCVPRIQEAWSRPCRDIISGPKRENKGSGRVPSGRMARGRNWGSAIPQFEVDENSTIRHHRLTSPARKTGTV
jgi:hypothetical protein